MTGDTTQASSHAMDISSLTGHSAKLSLANEKSCVHVNNFDLYYSEKQALNDITMVIPEKKSHGIYRAQRLW